MGNGRGSTLKEGGRSNSVAEKKCPSKNINSESELAGNFPTSPENKEGGKMAVSEEDWRERGTTRERIPQKWVEKKKGGELHPTRKKHFGLMGKRKTNNKIPKLPFVAQSG